MPRPCSVCNHEEVGQVNLVLTIGKESHRTIAERFGLSASAVQRHREHLPKKVAEATKVEEVRKEAKEAAEALDVIKQLKFINTLCYEQLVNARNSDKPGVVLRASEVVLKQLEFSARLMGEIGGENDINIYIENHNTLVQQFQVLQRVVVDALRPFPEAKQAVLEGLRKYQLEAGNE